MFFNLKIKKVLTLSKYPDLRERYLLMNLDTFFTTLYCLVDDWCEGSRVCDRNKPRTGPPTRMSDSEVLTLVIASQWRAGVPWRSERGMLRYMHMYGLKWFPTLLQQSQFNRRARQVWPALALLQQELGHLLANNATYEVVDCTPIPHCSLSQAKSHSRHWLSGKKGRGGNHGGWYYGEQLLLCATEKGVITGWLAGIANMDDRWMMEAFVSSRQGEMRLIEPELPRHRTYKHRYIPTQEAFRTAMTVGQDRSLTVLADGGFNGPRWIRHWKEQYNVTVIAPPSKNRKGDKSRKNSGWLAKHRQIIETVIARLTQTFDLHRVNAHSEDGMLTRLAGKMAAYNLAIWLNRSEGRPDGAMETLLC